MPVVGSLPVLPKYLLLIGRPICFLLGYVLSNTRWVTSA